MVMSSFNNFMLGGFNQEDKLRKIKSQIENEIIDFSREDFVLLDKNNKELYVLGIVISNEGNLMKLEIDDFINIVYVEDRKRVIEEIHKLLSGKQDKLKIEFRNFDKNKWFKLFLKEISERINENIVYCGYLYDITNEIVLNEQIERLIDFDKLTKLPSSYYIKDKINEKILSKDNKDNTSALILININHFKTINDSFNHSEGDLLLAKVAERLLNVIDADDLICRYGGDEFIIFRSLVNDEEDLKSYALKINNCFKEGFKINNNEIFIDISIGIAITSENGETFNELLKCADFALTRAKATKMDIYEIFDESFGKGLSRIYKISQKLRNALELHEFFVVFQPKILVSNFTVRGYEALIRWKNEELGLVNVADFIPIVESTRLIIPIGRFVLEESFKKVRELLDEGYSNFKIAVNFSEVQFRYGNIVEDFIELMDKYNVDGKYIEVEITESLLIKAFKDNITKLQQIKKLGITIALDDFGTGYSSLNYLTKLPIDVVKIDRSFVVDLNENEKNKKIVETIITLAHQLDIDVVAEGVEFKEQVDYLREAFCDMIQGYYFSKPMELNSAKKLLGKKFLYDFS